MTVRAATAFTVVIPAFNVGPLLREALESVARQTTPAAWVVVVDDGSTDGTADAAARWLDELALPGVVVAQANQGISAARNIGLDHRRTETIALLDADDVWLPQHLANLARAYALCPDAVVAFGDSRFFGDPRSRTDLIGEKGALAVSEAEIASGVHRLSPRVFDRTLPGQFFPISASSFRMDVGTPAPRFDTELPVGEDRFLFLHLARRGRFVYVHEQSCRTRRHPTNTTHHRREAWLREQGLRVLAKIRSDPALALTAEEDRVAIEAQREVAATLFYTASLAGLKSYRDARKLAASYVDGGWSIRDVARAAAVSCGIQERQVASMPD